MHARRERRPRLIDRSKTQNEGLTLLEEGSGKKGTWMGTGKGWEKGTQGRILITSIRTNIARSATFDVSYIAGVDIRDGIYKLMEAPGSKADVGFSNFGTTM